MRYFETSVLKKKFFRGLGFKRRLDLGQSTSKSFGLGGRLSSTAQFGQCFPKLRGEFVLFFLDTSIFLNLKNGWRYQNVLSK